MQSGFNMLVDCLLLFGFGVGVTIIFYILNMFFPPFKKFIDLFVNADKY